MSLEDEPLRRAMVTLGQAAGRTILGFYRQGRIRVDAKADGSPVTAADRAADLFLRERIAALTGDPVISEEAPIPDFGVRKDWTRYWLIDPLDGTRDFVQRSGEFCVCIARIEAGRPTLGVISAPALGITWSAVFGGGAFREVAGQERRIDHVRRRGPMVALISRYHRVEEAPPKGIDVVLSMGSAIKFGRMAEGSADLYLRKSPTHEWDIAAGDAITTEAGCTMFGPDGLAPLTYNQPNLKVPGFIVRSRRGSKLGA